MLYVISTLSVSTFLVYSCWGQFLFWGVLLGSPGCFSFGHPFRYTCFFWASISCFGSSFPFVICHFPLFLTRMAHISMQNFIPLSKAAYSYCLNQSLWFFFIFCKHLVIVHVYELINFLFGFNIFLVPNAFSIYVIGIMAITNRNGKGASPWKIRPWIFTSVKVYPVDNSIF